ncbi:acyl-CoA thioesterase/BAAT N-terminal domain-containing protein [Alkalihalobacillus sp. LMS6]|uniref:acyl-CoA thioesterase/bile acid-CoA:amino acid N-acyltransferase family protein n=1 Tax=Bacillaceae TaxID=186817 RepID=UPI000C084EB8|nr:MULTISPECIES: acyl-CoA thioesterase/bile acid-CoA:amino acid N-acyltransferase family protein [Bacillaceae]UTR07331.1 acyl-CoA thioesterase/BAAT N-terminal domain-containing protein [Alkalihalobacillus sp. LMS6]
MNPRLVITTQHAFIDQPLQISVYDCSSHQKMTIEVKTSDDTEAVFTASATYEANQDGNIHLAHHAPVSGSYQGVDPEGLIWSMDRKDKKFGDYFNKSTSHPLTYEFTLKDNKNVTLDLVQVHRKFYDETVKRVQVHEPDVVGTLFYPDTDHTFPGVLLLGGSDGGVNEHAAALLASKGYSVLSLAYFGAEGVAKDLENVPLEYFEHATNWLKTHSSVDETVSLIGYSRGGELALLLASTYNCFQAVIAGAPSAYVTSGLRNTIYAPIPAWTLGNKPIPYLKFAYTTKHFFRMGTSILTRKPFSFLPIWALSQRKANNLDDVRIPVEHIHAPLLTIAGEKDECWPAADYARIVQHELHDKRTDNEHLYYEEGGHFLAFPYGIPGMPTSTYMHVGGGMVMDFGGTKKGNADAARETWQHVQDFLYKHTKKTSLLYS